MISSIDLFCGAGGLTLGLKKMESIARLQLSVKKTLQTHLN